MRFTKTVCSSLAFCLLFLFAGCNLQNPAQMLEHLEKAQSALEKAAGTEHVSVNVSNTHMSIGAVDEKFESMKEEDKEELAEGLAVAAMQHWTDKWPITEIDVHIAYPIGEFERKASTFSFKPADLDLAEKVETATPAPSTTPEAVETGK
jgi:acid stress-induced BolA-like protein IbaG/YrbA